MRMEDCGFEIAGNPKRSITEHPGGLFREAFSRGLPEEREPTGKERSLEFADLPVSREHIASIPAVDAHRGAPELTHRRDMAIPAPAERFIEDRREHSVAADLCVKRLHEGTDRLFGDTVKFHSGTAIGQRS